jgi:hypothetical protein
VRLICCILHWFVDGKRGHPHADMIPPPPPPLLYLPVFFIFSALNRPFFLSSSVVSASIVTSHARFILAPPISLSLSCNPPPSLPSSFALNYQEKRSVGRRTRMPFSSSSATLAAPSTCLSLAFFYILAPDPRTQNTTSIHTQGEWGGSLSFSQSPRSLPCSLQASSFAFSLPSLSLSPPPHTHTPHTHPTTTPTASVERIVLYRTSPPSRLFTFLLIRDARDAAAKAIYAVLFSWIVKQVGKMVRQFLVRKIALPWLLCSVFMSIAQCFS